MKNFFPRRTLYALIAGLLFLLGAMPPQADAQITYTTPQTVNAIVANSVACTGSAQNFITSQSGGTGFRNLGQTQHYVSAVVSGAKQFTLEIDGIDHSGNVYRISDVLSLATSSTNGSVTGSGSYTNIQVSVTCTVGGTFTASYSGTSQTSNMDVGSFLFAQVDKQLVSGAAVGGTYTSTFQTPYANAAGTLYLQYITSAASNSGLTLQCMTASGTNNAPIILSPAATTNLQAWRIPPGVCPTATVQYTGGAGGTSVNIEYVFSQPGQSVNPLSNNYTHITGTTATVVSSISGTLHTLTINKGGAGTVSIFDLPGASCTGTPASSPIAIITATATTLQTFTYDVFAFSGICVQASATMDITVSASTSN